MCDRLPAAQQRRHPGTAPALEFSGELNRQFAREAVAIRSSANIGKRDGLAVRK